MRVLCYHCKQISFDQPAFHTDAALVPPLLPHAKQATFEGTPLVTSQGLVTLPPEIPDGSEIH